jgi:hypothetical protein
MKRGLPAVLACLLALLPAPARSQTLPIFDAHIHYSEPDWDALTPDQALSILAGANVVRALVSSTPDDGTLRLHRRAPQRIVPVLRPYRTRADMATWTRDPSVAAWVEERLKRGIYRGIGEFHLGVEDVEAPVVRRLAELAEQGGLFLHAHVAEITMERLLIRYPRVRMIWAHAGMSATPAGVERLLDRFTTLWVELSLRTDVAPGGRLDPAWRALFLKHPDRFMVGTDTWVTSRWQTLPQTMQAVRDWLTQLPRDVAERIAFRNGDRLFPP